MTPLAQRVAREMLLPVRRRSFDDQCGLLNRLSDMHCFEVTDVIGLANDLAQQYPDYGRPLPATFLPAPRTWVEWRVDGVRTALFFEQAGLGSDIAVYRVRGWNTKFDAEKWFFANEQNLILPLQGSESLERKRRIDITNTFIRKWCSEENSSEFMAALLAIINTPRLIGRKQHMPHVGFERSILRSRPLIGKFPLHAWTELKLSVSAMMKQADGVEHEAHLTGEKCLHFCRAHIRVRNGRLEQVRAHWRGDPALGIKRTRYKVVA